MKDTFDAYVEYVLMAEGEHSDHPEDRGGETQHGFSEKFLRSIGMGGQTITRDRAISLYRRYFWEGYQCHQMHPFVGWCACDAYVNHSPGTAALLIQQGLGVEVDGKVGPKTLQAAKTPNTRLFWQRYRAARIDFYQDIVDNDPSQVSFIRGWNDRLHKLVEAIYYAGLLEKESKTIVERIASKPMKVTAAGVGLGSLIAAFEWFTGTPLSDFAQTGSGPMAVLTGIVGAWLTSLKLKD